MPESRARTKRARVDGVIAIDKPSGPTSFDIVAQVRRAYGSRAVGHAGTLDPLATGVLVVMLGEATKLSDYLTAADKQYVAEVSFGRTTDTLDSQGKTICERAILDSEVTEAKVQAILELEHKRTEQVPPAFSAIKQAGETAYKKARRGESVVLAPRPVKVEDLRLVTLSSQGLTLALTVSKGYYVRSLVRDICEALSVPGCLTALRRLRSGAFNIEQAAPWPLPAGASPPALMSLGDAARRSLPSGVLTEEGIVRARHGKRLTVDEFRIAPLGTPSAWLSEAGELVAVGEQVTTEPHSFRVLRGFQTSQSIHDDARHAQPSSLQPLGDGFPETVSIHPYRSGETDL